MMPTNQIGSPVFICGYPKSGTTLLLALLDSHPALLVYPEETRYFKQILNSPERQNLDYVYSATSVRTFAQGKVTRTSGERDYSAIDFSAYQEILAEHWQISQQSPAFHKGSLLESLVYSYGQVTGQIARKYWVEKTPFNEKYLTAVAKLWPDLKALYIIRDPRDNFCSYGKRRHKSHMGRKEKYAHADRVTQQREITPSLTIAEFVAYWLDSLYYWRRFAAQKQTNCLLVRYEDLVERPETTLQRICEFLQINWHDALVSPTRNGVPWSGNSMHGEKFSGISTASLGRYRELLTDAEISSLAGFLRKTIQNYGWPLADAQVSQMKLVFDLILSGHTSPYIKGKVMMSLLQQQMAKE